MLNRVASTRVRQYKLETSEYSFFQISIDAEPHGFELDGKISPVIFN